MNRPRGLALLGVLGLVGILGAAVLIGSDIAKSNERPRSVITGGDFVLTLESRKATFSSAEPLDIVASIEYRGPAESVVIGQMLWLPIEFFMKAPGATLRPSNTAGCAELDLSRGVPLTESLLDFDGAAHPFAVPHGLHEVAALADLRVGGCTGAGQSLQTAIVVAVTDGPDDIPIFTDIASEVTACLLLRNGGRLTRSATGLGVVDFEGQLRDVVWPMGYSALNTSDGAVLVGRDSRPIAREGQLVSFDATTPDHGPIWPCGDVELRG